MTKQINSFKKREKDKAEDFIQNLYKGVKVEYTEEQAERENRQYEELKMMSKEEKDEILRKAIELRAEEDEWQ